MIKNVGWLKGRDKDQLFKGVLHRSYTAVYLGKVDLNTRIMFHAYCV